MLWAQLELYDETRFKHTHMICCCTVQNISAERTKGSTLVRHRTVAGNRQAYADKKTAKCSLCTLDRVSTVHWLDFIVPITIADDVLWSALEHNRVSNGAFESGARLQAHVSESA